MAAERPLPTLEQMGQAERRIGVAHPIITAIDTHLPTINQLGNLQVGDDQDERGSIIGQIGFLADAFVDAGSFTLTPTDLVAVWSRVSEIFPRSDDNRALAIMVGSAYAIQGTENPEFRKLPKHFLETRQLPEEVLADRESLLHVHERLDHIRQSLDDLHFYVYGTTESPMAIGSRLTKQEMAGDPNAKAEYDQFLARQEERSTPVIALIHDSFANGFNPLRWSIDSALQTA